MADGPRSDASTVAHSGAMIALMPTPEDARRLAVSGGESAAELHCTLMFLGPDASVFSPSARQEILGTVQAMIAYLPAVDAKIFGISHWNAESDNPSWVWSVGDTPDGVCLEEAHGMIRDCMYMCAGAELVPDQHTPWVAHICAEYTDDLTLAKTLEKRLGPVTFDRIRVSFGDEDTDIPLTGGMTSSGVLRRKLTEMEVASRCDFAMVDKQWESAVSGMMRDYVMIENNQRAELREQIIAAVDSDDLDALDRLHVSTDETARLLFKHMISLAGLAGKEMQREAESQGVSVPPWDLGTALAASSATDVLTAVSRVVSRSLGLNLVQSAARRVTAYIGSRRSGRSVSDAVDAGLKDLSSATPREAIGSAMSSAQNAGRMAVLRVAPAGQYLASEALDKNTCGPCRNIDGSEFTSLRAAEAAYPSGGYIDCQGGGRCRGTMIAVWDRGETASATQEAGMPTATEALGGKPNPGTKKDKRLHENDDYTEKLADCPPGSDCEDDGSGTEMSGSTSDDLKTDISAVAIRPEDIRLTDDGRITDVEGNEITSFATEGCPPNMELDPATGECMAVKSAAAAGQTATWEGVLVVEGVTTGDGREFAPEALSFPEEIEPGEVLLRWNKEDSHGGEQRTLAVTVGRIDRIWRDGNKLMGEGVFDLGQPDGVEAHRRVQEKFLRGVSIDADDVKNADVEFVWPTSASEGENSEDVDLFELMFAQPEKVVYHGGRIRAATLCDIPAFVEAYIALKDESGAITAGGAPTLDEAIDTQKSITAQRARTKPKGRSLSTALVAHGGPEWRPPAEWFTNPQLSMPTTIQVTDDGRVYGHAAQWGACHIGFMDVCTQPPREDDFPYFMTGELVTDNGKRVTVGQITVTANHADLYAGAGPAKEHYENTGNAIADVSVGADRVGIWVAGAIRPNADPMLVHELRASGEVSGDWRRIGGSHRLVGLLGVNVGGFVVPRMRARVAGGEVQSLIAAGRLTTAHNIGQQEAKTNAYKLVMDDLAQQIFEGSE